MSFRTAYGYERSENGWRMCNRDECVVANPVPNSNTAPVRRGDAATILNAWLIYYHRYIEPISTPVWGWSLENEVWTSNHLSGTAVDIHAPRYPWGLRTMPAARIAQVRDGLRKFEGTIFWGADWGRADEMHYQIGFPEGDKRIAAFAAKLNAGHLGIYGDPAPAPAPVPPPPPPNLINREYEVSRVWLGARKFEGERDALNGGKYVDYEHGSIYWHHDTGALPVPTLVYEVWQRHDWERGPLGYPISYHTVHDTEGDVQMFAGAGPELRAIIARKYGTDGHVVYGVIGKRWREQGDVTGELGWPVSEEYDNPDDPGGRRQDFENGSLVWHPTNAPKVGGQG